MAAIEHPTLIIDIDPQSNTTSGLGIDISTVTNSIYEVMIGSAEINDTIRQTELDFLDLVPAHINLVGAEIEMIDRDQRERILTKALAELRDKYDFIIIDCPPSLGLLTINALTASDSILIPVHCEYFALEGLGQLLNTIKSIQVAAEVKRYFDDRVFKTVIARNVRLAEAPSFGKPALLYDSTSMGAKNYLALASEIIKRNRKLFKNSPLLTK